MQYSSSMIEAAILIWTFHNVLSNSNILWKFVTFLKYLRRSYIMGAEMGVAELFGFIKNGFNE